MALAWGLTACVTATAPAPAATATASPASTATMRVGVTPASAPTAAPAPASPPVPTRAPLNLSGPRLVVLAENLPGPDDLALASDGSIYFSDVGDRTVKRYTPDGNVAAVVSGLIEPEGIVVLPDGSLVIAEQGRNRLVRYDPATKSLTPFLDLENKTGRPGVDGIVLDALTHDAITIIIPDSPNGRVLRASLDGRTVTEIARGFARPTGAWVERDGSILVVDESAGTLKRLRPDGTVEKLATLPVPDDVIADEAGNIFVNTLGDGAIHVISAATKQDSILVGGLANPQGVIFDADGNLVVADAGHHRLVKIVIR